MTFLPDSSYKHYRLGFFAACSSFIIWGTLPLYWYFLSHVEAGEILSHRIAWSFVFMLFVLIFAGRKQLKEDLAFLREKTSRIFLLLTAAVLVTANWLTYIWAVTHGHVIDTSIGYYLNPLLSVLLGVVMFSEKLSTPKRISIVLAAIGLALMTWQGGHFPWLALLLAGTFALYGAVKKMLHLQPISSITLETLIVLTPSIIYIYNLHSNSSGHFLTSDVTTTFLLLGAGIVTAVPLLLFSYGANELPLNVLGFIQYISPTLAFVWGIFFFHEPFGTDKLIALSFIWISLVIFTIGERLQISRSTYKQKKRS